MPFGYFNNNVLMTRDLVPIEPKVQELKFYARGRAAAQRPHRRGRGAGELVSYAPGS